MWAGSFFIHQQLCVVLVSRKLWPVAMLWGLFGRSRRLSRDLKLCKIFGAVVLGKISNEILSGLSALPHLISLIAEANLVDERGMDNRPSALGNRFSPVFQAQCSLLILLKVPLVNVKNVELRRRR